MAGKFLLYGKFVLRNGMVVRNKINISRVAASSILAAAAVFLALTAAVSATAAAVRYDVSYFWSGSFEGIQAYRDRVADALGPEAARGLRVVAKGDLFGLVYEHPGGRSGALRVAEEHSRLLKSRGLEAAMAVPARDWERLEDEGPRETSFPPAGASGLSRDVSKETEQGSRDSGPAVFHRELHRPSPPGRQDQG